MEDLPLLVAEVPCWGRPHQEGLRLAPGGGTDDGVGGGVSEGDPASGDSENSDSEFSIMLMDTIHSVVRCHTTGVLAPRRASGGSETVYDDAGYARDDLAGAEGRRRIERSARRAAVFLKWVASGRPRAARRLL